MDKKFFGFTGLSGLACVACCAFPLLSIAGLGASFAAFWNGALPYIIGGLAVLALVVVLQVRKRTAVSCSANFCDINCGCKSK